MYSVTVTLFAALSLVNAVPLTINNTQYYVLTATESNNATELNSTASPVLLENLPIPNPDHVNPGGQSPSDGQAPTVAHSPDSATSNSQHVAVSTDTATATNSEASTAAAPDKGADVTSEAGTAADLQPLLTDTPTADTGADKALLPDSGADSASNAGTATDIVIDAAAGTLEDATTVDDNAEFVRLISVASNDTSLDILVVANDTGAVLMPGNDTAGKCLFHNFDASGVVPDQLRA